MKKIYIITFILLLLVVAVKGQDANFSQYYAAPLYLNPALSGLETSPHLAVNYRSQWKNMNTPHYVGQASFIYPIYLEMGGLKEHQGGVGVSVFNEIAGQANSFKNYGGSLTAAYNVMLGANATQMLSFGLQGAFVQNSIDFGKLTWGSQYDPYMGFNPGITPSVDLNYQTSSYLSFNAGIVYYFSTAPVEAQNSFSGFVGLSANHLNRPNQSFFTDQSEVQLPLLYKLHGGVEIKSSDQTLAISPNFLILQQNNIRQYDFGSYFTYNLLGNNQKECHLILGTWYRLQDSFILSVGLNTSQYTVGFSYDSNVSRLRYNASEGGAFEISINYAVSKQKKIRKFSTPLI